MLPGSLPCNGSLRIWGRWGDNELNQSSIKRNNDHGPRRLLRGGDRNWSDWSDGQRIV